MARKIDYYKGDVKTFRVKWVGFQLLDDSYDISEAKLLASGYSVEDVEIYPSKEKYRKKKKNRDNKIFVVSMNDLYMDKETTSLDEETWID